MIQTKCMLEEVGNTYGNGYSQIGLFTSGILKIFVEDRRPAHMERVNNSKNTITIYISDLVIAHTNIQSDKTKDKSVNP